MATIDVKDAGGSTVALEKPNGNGRAAAASSRPVALSTEDKAALDALTAAATEGAYQQISSVTLASATALTPSGATTASIQNNGTAAVRYRADGTDPTATSGMRLLPGRVLPYTGNLAALKFIREAAGAVLDIHYTTGAPQFPAGDDAPAKNYTDLNIATGTTLTRPANTTAYAANDSISDNGTAGSVTAQPLTLSDTNDEPVFLEEILLDTTDTGLAAGVQIAVHVFNSDPTASSGVVGGDNAAWSNKKAGYVGRLSGTFRAFSDGGKARCVPDEGLYLPLAPGSGAKTIWLQYQALGGFTPSANSTTIIPTAKAIQARV